jgi:hypothetical protein
MIAREMGQLWYDKKKTDWIKHVLSPLDRGSFKARLYPENMRKPLWRFV